MSQRIDTFAENPLPPIAEYTANKGDGSSNIADALGIKTSAIKALNINVREGFTYSLRKGPNGEYLLQEKGITVSVLQEKNIFLPKYGFAGYTFSLEKTPTGYKLKGKGNTEFASNIPFPNLDLFVNEVSPILGILMTESYSRISQQQLALELKEIPPYNNVFRVNSEVWYDLIGEEIDTGKLIGLFSPKLSDGEEFLRFLISNINIQKKSA